MILTGQNDQVGFTEALNNAWCPTCMKRMIWEGAHIKPDSGTSPREAVEFTGECCGVSYRMQTVDPPASEHAELFATINIVQDSGS